LSELPDLLGARPVRSELVYLLVGLDREFTAQSPPGRWEDYYAGRIAEHSAPTVSRLRSGRIANRDRGQAARLRGHAARR
jgi:hypothetical protein